ncbi:hypothetical protein [Burkholderia sp. Bp9140]|uniref:hypothetical protein n=1 Tax=Burkholderia sp. Bp9140 TaxID=2184572 RepID=UPI000F57113A|nr:hypothetical protein [Burkholderia sp. Bp9140]
MTIIQPAFKRNGATLQHLVRKCFLHFYSIVHASRPQHLPVIIPVIGKEARIENGAVAYVIVFPDLF